MTVSRHSISYAKKATKLTAKIHKAQIRIHPQNQIIHYKIHNTRKDLLTLEMV
jgi:hypothetical protein